MKNLDTTFNSNGRKVSVYVSTKEDENVEYFINKFAMKMSDSLPSTAAWWIDGIGEISDESKKRVWDGIQHLLDTESRDRQAEHGDMPEWI